MRNITEAYKKVISNKTTSESDNPNPKEYDYEGEMTKKDLEVIIMHAERLMAMMNDADNLPEWVQAKITIAKDYMQTVCDYLYAEKQVEENVEKPTGDLKDACWKGYTAVGLKKKNGKVVPNCVPDK